MHRSPRPVRRIMDRQLSLSNFRRKRRLRRSPCLVRRIAVKIDWKKSSEKRDPRHGITGVILVDSFFRNKVRKQASCLEKQDLYKIRKRSILLIPVSQSIFGKIWKQKQRFLPPRTVQNLNFVSAERVKRSAVIRGDQGASRREARSV